jgi:hypothetical protein
MPLKHASQTLTQQNVILGWAWAAKDRWTIWCRPDRRSRLGGFVERFVELRVLSKCGGLK